MDEKYVRKDIIKDANDTSYLGNIVLEKYVFSNIFEKDIRRVYMYKKAEKIGKAIHLIAPAFKDIKSLRDRIHQIAIGVIDAATLPPQEARNALSRELLALSSVLSMAQVSRVLSPMNVEIIAKEAHDLLQEIASYQEPKISLEEVPSIAVISKATTVTQRKVSDKPREKTKENKGQSTESIKDISKGHIAYIKDVEGKKDRKDSILSVLSTNGPSYIKDISTVIRDVSEKTIQRELQALVAQGRVVSKGKRRWTTYEVASPQNTPPF